MESVISEVERKIASSFKKIITTQIKLITQCPKLKT